MAIEKVKCPFCRQETVVSTCGNDCACGAESWHSPDSRMVMQIVQSMSKPGHVVQIRHVGKFAFFKLVEANIPQISPNIVRALASEGDFPTSYSLNL